MTKAPFNQHHFENTIKKNCWILLAKRTALQANRSLRLVSAMTNEKKLNILNSILVAVFELGSNICIWKLAGEQKKMPVSMILLKRVLKLIF